MRIVDIIVQASVKITQCSNGAVHIWVCLEPIENSQQRNKQGTMWIVL